MEKETNFEIHKLYNGTVEVKYFPTSHIYMVDGKRKSGASTIAGVKDKSTAMVSWALETGAAHLFDLLAEGKKLTAEDVIRATYASENAKNAAADLGTAVHDWCEQYIRFKLKQKGTEMPEMPEDKNIITGVTSFLEWEANHKVKYLWTEKVLYSKRGDFVGRADFGAMVDGKRVLCDLKTGNGLYNAVLLQTAGYVLADEEESPGGYDGRWAIRISKETEKEYFSRMELKNKIKNMLGKKTGEIAPYQVFEAKFLDPLGTEMKRDMKAFLAAKALLDWNNATDFYKNK